MNMECLLPDTIPDSPAFHTVAVTTVRHWNDHLFSFSVERPGSFRFRSGEFVMLGLPQDGGKPLLRAYSIASPAWADELDFLSIKVPGGPLTSRLKSVRPGDQLYLGRKPTGTLVADALLGGKRLFLLSTGTGLAPFLSIARDPEIYSRFEQVVVVHSVRRVSDLAYHDQQTALWADDPLIHEEAAVQFYYVPTVTREPFHTTERIGTLVENGGLFPNTLDGPRRFDPEQDRIMLCGSMAMIRETSAMLEKLGFVEGSNSRPGTYVIERAFVD
ncbi:ferredoxin--NADP+ reductase [Stakelama pacifica]|uniref:ferredoxin--NADP(+) reductase n=2 Tax=Stakelama pacifica TaxID=517720 RepID=A0A4R6FYM2_9SPHN|nr:ferredoxin--NADP+ reductase [Stakelama pacifica]GGO89709.1 ferredoxin--NADP(+) reductase [Stakelama pacifica]